MLLLSILWLSDVLVVVVCFFFFLVASPRLLFSPALRQPESSYW